MPEDLPFLTPLDAIARRAAGVPDRFNFAIADRVRFYELDALNHVNHTAYLRWFESFRLPYLKDRGISRYDAESPELVLKQVEVSYHAPMFLGETYVVAGRTMSYRNTSFRMEYAVFADGLRVEGRTLVVLLKKDGSGKYALTPEMRQSLISKDGALDDGVNS